MEWRNMYKDIETEQSQKKNRHADIRETRLFIVEMRNGGTLLPIIREHVEANSMILSDDSPPYRKIVARGTSTDLLESHLHEFMWRSRQTRDVYNIFENFLDQASSHAVVRIKAQIVYLDAQRIKDKSFHKLKNTFMARILTKLMLVGPLIKYNENVITSQLSTQHRVASNVIDVNQSTPKGLSSLPSITYLGQRTRMDATTRLPCPNSGA
ncbi:hypothetical protein RF11_12601 [Thelohanellus kitauei]|uniref:ISXO2-like transposase domain-containing protein n=1 Tax=Thelohanellus kitauei TaxID=669202 RepID=A0A0C2MUL2_THEKT|nr:hypothetical protein RF11_12601 [Thelohanellus kitauei]